jgi:O-antigen ligase
VDSVFPPRGRSLIDRLRFLDQGPEVLGALLIGGVLTIVWLWWTLAFGAFFPTVLYPGTVLTFLFLALLIPFTPLPIQTRGPHVVAVGSLLALALWMLLSAFWSPVPDAAIEDAVRTGLYAAAFTLGLWFAVLLGRSVVSSLAPIVVAGGFLVTLTLVRAVLAGDSSALLSGDGTLDYPLGYRNAEAALSFVVFWVATGAASHPRTSIRWRIPSAAIASGALSLAVLSQSRGSLLAASVALVVYVISSRDRARAVSTLFAIAAPVLISVPVLVSPFDALGDPQALLTGLHRAGAAAILTSIISAGLVYVTILAARRGVFDRPSREIPRRAVAIGAVCLVIAAVPILAAAGTGDWIDERVTEFQEGGVPDLATSESRFTFSASSSRNDYWRVALDDALQNPVLGTGAGGFEVTYLRERDSPETPRDAHNVVLEIAGEFGLPGLLLFLAAATAAVTAAIRSRQYGPNAALVSSVALTCAAYWAVQSSIDWLWSFPVPTAVVLALLGSASAVSSRALRDRSMRNRRRGAILALVAGSILIIPFFVSERLTAVGAREQASGETGDAYRDLQAAADLNRLSDTPLLLLAETARRAGDDQRALDALAEARSRQPDDYVNYVLTARVLAPTDPQAALRELDRARTLNPNEPTIDRLERRLVDGRQEPD